MYPDKITLEHFVQNLCTNLNHGFLNEQGLYYPSSELPSSKFPGSKQDYEKDLHKNPLQLKIAIAQVAVGRRKRAESLIDTVMEYNSESSEYEGLLGQTLDFVVVKNIALNAYGIIALNSLGRKDAHRVAESIINWRKINCGKLECIGFSQDIPPRFKKNMSKKDYYLVTVALNKLGYRDEAKEIFERANNLSEDSLEFNCWKIIAMRSMGPDYFGDAKRTMECVIRRFYNSENSLFKVDRVYGTAFGNLEEQVLGMTTLLSIGEQEEAAKIANSIMKNFYIPEIGLFSYAKQYQPMATNEDKEYYLPEIDNWDQSKESQLKKDLKPELRYETAFVRSIEGNAELIFTLQCFLTPSTLGIYLPDNYVPRMPSAELLINIPELRIM